MRRELKSLKVSYRAILRQVAWVTLEESTQRIEIYEKGKFPEDLQELYRTSYIETPNRRMDGSKKSLLSNNFLIFMFSYDKIKGINKKIIDVYFENLSANSLIQNFKSLASSSYPEIFKEEIAYLDEEREKQLLICKNNLLESLESIKIRLNNQKMTNNALVIIQLSHSLERFQEEVNLFFKARGYENAKAVQKIAGSIYGTSSFHNNNRKKPFLKLLNTSFQFRELVSPEELKEVTELSKKLEDFVEINQGMEIILFKKDKGFLRLARNTLVLEGRERMDIKVENLISIVGEYNFSDDFKSLKRDKGFSDELWFLIGQIAVYIEDKSYMSNVITKYTDVENLSDIVDTLISSYRTAIVEYTYRSGLTKSARLFLSFLGTESGEIPVGKREINLICAGIYEYENVFYQKSTGGDSNGKN